MRTAATRSLVLLYCNCTAESTKRESALLLLFFNTIQKFFVQSDWGGRNQGGLVDLSDRQLYRKKIHSARGPGISDTWSDTLHIRRKSVNYFSLLFMSILKCTFKYWRSNSSRFLQEHDIMARLPIARAICARCAFANAFHKRMRKRRCWPISIAIATSECAKSMSFTLLMEFVCIGLTLLNFYRYHEMTIRNVCLGAALLYPYSKNFAFLKDKRQNPRLRNEIIDQIAKEMTELESYKSLCDESKTNFPTSHVTNLTILEDFFTKSDKKKNYHHVAGLLADDVIRGYISSPDKTMKALSSFPPVAELFSKCNTVIPSSAPCECLFSAAKRILTAYRCKLTNRHFELRLMLKVNQFESWIISFSQK